MEKVLILGASGLVGRALINELKADFDLYGTFSSSPLTSLSEGKSFRLEVQQIEIMRQLIGSIKPDIVISFLRGNFDDQLQFHKELALELRNSQSRLYFFSTTNVFDGDFTKPHTETDTPISESDYGKFKIECEKMLKEILDDRAMIIRIPAIWGKSSPRWNRVLETINENKRIELYSNLVYSNLLDVQLARQLRYIIENTLKGTFHLTSEDLINEGQFFEEMIGRLACEKELLQFSLFQGNENTHYFALKSTRKDLPDRLQMTNRDIISYLLGSF
ncbi:MAG: dTDP-4-dehydrorhamnose reductase [Neobacillus sp.]|nr:dTDP-4-dehydrorhamnose reductase [Neobacillus sp.]